MNSNLFYLAILVATATLWEKTSALRMRDAIQTTEIDLWEDAKEAMAGGYSGVRFNLAPSFGKLDSKALKHLDQSLKVMMGGILKLDLGDQYNWEDIRKTLDSSPLTIRQTKKEHYKLDRIHFKSLKVLGIGQSKAKRGFQIRSWFTNLVGNMDILKDSHIDVNKMVDLVTKFSINMWTKLFTVRSRKVGLMDLGILRFPDVSQPYFALYRISLTGKCTFRTYIFYQKEYSDVVGIFHKLVYYPDRKHIKSLSEGLKQALIREVEDLFSFA